jgi:hypothetical protein
MELDIHPRPEYPVELAQVAYLDESNIGGLFSEALSADVQAILADKTSLVRANSALKHEKVSYYSSLDILHLSPV